MDGDKLTFVYLSNVGSQKKSNLLFWIWWDRAMIESELGFSNVNPFITSSGDLKFLNFQAILGSKWTDWITWLMPGILNVQRFRFVLLTRGIESDMPARCIVARNAIRNLLLGFELFFNLPLTSNTTSIYHEIFLNYAMFSLLLFISGLNLWQEGARRK